MHFDKESIRINYNKHIFGMFNQSNLRYNIFFISSLVIFSAIFHHRPIFAFEVYKMKSQVIVMGSGIQNIKIILQITSPHSPKHKV